MLGFLRLRRLLDPELFPDRDPELFPDLDLELFPDPNSGLGPGPHCPLTVDEGGP